jgi:glycosyltransferase involved in cell wall biosynthesis
MKILTDVRLFSRGGASGIEEYTKNLLNSLFALDRKNDYFLFYNGWRKTPLNLNLKFPNIQVVDWRIPNKIFEAASRFLSWPKVDHFIKADVIFSPHFNILTTGKTPRIITFHDISFVHHPYFFSQKQRFWHWLQNVKKQAREADRIIAVSKFTKNDLVNTLEIPPEKIKVIYSGISEEFQRSNHLIAHFPFPISYFPYILYLGTLEPRKNISLIIRAFNLLKPQAEFKHFKLILAGKPGWLYNNVVKEARQSLFNQDILFLGQINRRDRAALYSRAEIFIYPSFFEGFGFPPLEAQACGCPVIAANRASLPEILGDSAILINPWKPEELAEAVRRVISDQELKRKLIEAGLNNAKRFCWQTAAAETLKALQL